MKNKLVALDTNVLVYIHDINSAKKGIAGNLLAEGPCIPSQVISEYLNTIRRLIPIPKEEMLIQTSGLLKNCTIIPTKTTTLKLAADLVKAYKFQIFDAIIVASALEGHCTILYSEDMQNGLVVNKALTIVNPFL